ncbi:MAG: RNA methyltransferase [Pseudomonadota bacterium]
MQSLNTIRFVLDHTSHPGNIGATARAMKVMGLKHLSLVAPLKFPHAEATALASSADDLLDQASVYDTLDQAVADCTLVIGSSARHRTVSQEQIAPREAAQRMLDESGPVAVVFGCERSGLDNEALDRCHLLVAIPTAAEYQSLNLAQAVQVIAYELRQAALARGQRAIESPLHVPARAERMEVFFQRLERTVQMIRYGGAGQTETLHRRLRQLFLRARPSDDELNLFNGILSKTQQLAERQDRYEKN